MNKTRYLGWLSVISLLALTACGSGNGNPSESATGNSDTTQSTPEQSENSDPAQSPPSDDTAADPAPENVPPPAPTSGLPIEQAMVAEINAVRAAGATCGSEVFGPAGPVTWDINMESAAALHNAYMRAEEKFSHIGQGNSTPSERLTASGFEWNEIAENIAAGYPDVASVLQGWMNSNGHCRNIMNPAFDTIGADKADGYETSDFSSYWTLLLAAKSAAS